MKTRLCSLLLILSMVAATFTLLVTPAMADDEVSNAPVAPTTPVPAQNPTIWSGDKAASFAGGTGVEGDPYLIETAEQLALIADYSSAWFQLQNDIYLNNPSLVKNWGKDNDFSTLEDKSALKIWTPIATFSGNLNGNGNTVFGLYCAGVTDGALINLVDTGAVVQNLQVAYSTVDCTGGSAAILAMALKGTINGCHVIHCNVYNTKNNTAGICACYYQSTISNTTFTGHIKSNSGNAAGITASHATHGITVNIRNCAVYGTVTNIGGGAAGMVYTANKSNAQMHIYDSINYADITGKSNAGGLMGESGGTTTGGVMAAVVINCINYGDVTATNGIAGGVIAKSAQAFNNTGNGSGVTVFNFANYGEIKAQGQNSMAGGIIGNYGATDSFDKNGIKIEGSNQACVIYNCVLAGKVTAESGNAGSIIGKINTEFADFSAAKITHDGSQRVLLVNVRYADEQIIGGTADATSTVQNYIDKIFAEGKVVNSGELAVISLDSLKTAMNAVVKEPPIIYARDKGTNPVTFSYDPLQWGEVHATSIQGASLQLGNSVAINLYSEAQLTFNGWNNHENKVVVSGNGETKELTNLGYTRIDGKEYFHYQLPVNPAEIGDTFTFTLNGNSIEYGVEAYAVRKYANGSAKLQGLLEALMAYGDAARVNKGVEAKSMAAIGKTYDANAIDTAYESVNISPAEGGNEKFISASLNLNGHINLLLKVADGVKKVSVTYQYTDTEGNVQTSIAKVVDVANGEAVYEGIVATALNLHYHLVALDDAGNVLGEMDWNVSRFIQNGLNGNFFNVSQATLAKALALYMQAARIYTGLDEAAE